MEAPAGAWRLYFADRDPLEVYFAPRVRRAEAVAAYPGACAAERIPDTPQRAPTTAEAAELRRLVRAVGGHDRWPADDIEDATAAALADPDGALLCYRVLAADRRILHQVRSMAADDDRRRCTECTNLTPRGACQAARRGEIAASRDYRPLNHTPRRCEGYLPGPEDTDRRPGRERWPRLLRLEDAHASDSN